MSRKAIAIAAHPDDIEFLMAGTLLLLKNAGWEIHYFNIATGNCGTTVLDPQSARIARAREGKEAAEVLGAVYHSSVCDDLEIVYSVELLRKVEAVIREVGPEIVLTHSQEDYMEDHMNASRLAVTAAFALGMPNFTADPPTPPVKNPKVTVYHALPHGLRDGLRRRVRAGSYADTGDVHKVKRRALAAHRSQKEWLDVSQGMDSYLITMDELSRKVGKMSGHFEHAEGWRRHSHLGFSAEDRDPLVEILEKKYEIDEEYEKNLG